MLIAHMKKSTIRNMEISLDVLDTESRQVVKDFAKKHDYLIFAEAVRDKKTPDATFFAENGEISRG